VLKTFSRPDTLTTSLQDWRKGRRAEIQEVNGYVIDILRKHGIEAPINQRFVEIVLDVESGAIEARPDIAPNFVKFLDSN
jgi:2-dehydropantoate 2-reductase